MTVMQRFIEDTIWNEELAATLPDELHFIWLCRSAQRDFLAFARRRSWLVSKLESQVATDEDAKLVKEMYAPLLVDRFPVLTAPIAELMAQFDVECRAGDKMTGGMARRFMTRVLVGAVCIHPDDLRMQELEQQEAAGPPPWLANDPSWG
ncbi:hypothetical protein I6F15_04475 [Bradyrhizobium sp. BRP14]|nr:hypothetical protein [Bradyrhizobium sp. BRP14]